MENSADKIIKLFKEKILPTLNSNKIIILLIIVIAGSFYWFQIRPERIRSNCFNITVEILKDSKVDNYDFLFRACLNKNGIK